MRSSAATILIEKKREFAQIFVEPKWERMANRFRIENTVGDFRFHFDLYWNESGRLTRVAWNEVSITPLLPETLQPPYGVAAVLRDLHGYFRDGAPLLPLHWELLYETELTQFAR